MDGSHDNLWDAIQKLDGRVSKLEGEKEELRSQIAHLTSSRRNLTWKPPGPSPYDLGARGRLDYRR